MFQKIILIIIFIFFGKKGGIENDGENIFLKKESIENDGENIYFEKAV